MDNDEKFRLALQLRDFEIAQLTQRNNFFMVFQGVLFAGLVQSDHTKPVVSFMVCITGLLVSMYQVGMACGAKFWQEYWEQKVADYESAALTTASQLSIAQTAELFHSNKTLYLETVKRRMRKDMLDFPVNLLIARRFSVSKIPIYAGISMSVVWLLLVLCTLQGDLTIPKRIVGF